MQKKIVIPVMVCLLSANYLFVPVCAEENSDISFEALVNNFKTQRDNYGKVGDENIDKGYQTYLKNVSTSASLLAEKLEDFNEYNYENLDIYKEIEDIYQDALKSQEDLSESTLEAYEKAKEEAKAATNKAQEEANQAFNEFSSKMASLKSEIASMKASVTSGALAAASTKYSNSSSEYSSIMNKIKEGQGINYYKESSFFDSYTKAKEKMDAAILGQSSNGTLGVTSALQQNISSAKNTITSFGIADRIKEIADDLMQKAGK